MRIGVTGAEGKVGQALVQELLEHQYVVRAITLHPWVESPTENVIADVTQYEQVYEAFVGCDAIIHLAGLTYPIPDQDSRVFHTNTTGLFNVELAAGNLNIQKVVVASSDCVLGVTFSHQKTEPVYFPIDELHPTTPDNSYGLSKLVGEQVSDGMAKRFNMSIVSLRISAVFDTAIYQSDWFIDDLNNPERGVTDNLWSYVDLRDCARAFRLAIEADVTGHEIIHITARDTRAIVPSMELIATFFPHIVPSRHIEGNATVHDCSKAVRLLGFVPEYSWRGDDHS
jgi:nucleoside-diphosphate-sugar epimerase